jgi:hypothetical protein
LPTAASTTLETPTAFVASWANSRGDGTSQPPESVRLAVFRQLHEIRDLLLQRAQLLDELLGGEQRRRIEDDRRRGLIRGNFVGLGGHGDSLSVPLQGRVVNRRPQAHANADSADKPRDPGVPGAEAGHADSTPPVKLGKRWRSLRSNSTWIATGFVLRLVSRHAYLGQY